MVLQQKIPTAPVKTYIIESARIPVGLRRLSEFPESYLTARRERGQETEGNEEFLVWFPDAKNRERLVLRSTFPSEDIEAASTSDSKLKAIDPSVVRDQFLKITEPGEGLLFFQRYGIFGEEHSTVFNYATALSFSDVRRWQDVFRQCWLTKPINWLAIAEKFSGLRYIERIRSMPQFSFWVGGHVRFRLRCRCVREVILAAIWFDKLAEVKTSQCHRSDCTRVFNHESGHEKKYCTSECAHLAAVRRHRKKLKKASRG